MARQRRRGSRNRQPRQLLLWIAGTLLAVLQTAPASLAVPASGIEVPQPTRVERFNPDQEVCRSQAIRAGFARNLQPWADQPPAVLEQLRRMQLEMTRATLQRCVSKGLMLPAEASQLERELGLQAGPGGTTPPPPPTAAPAASGASAKP